MGEGDLRSGTVPYYAPYVAATPGFKIGLQRLDIRNWIEVDENLVAHLDETERVLREHRSQVFVAKPSSYSAQKEVLDLLWWHLCDEYPDIYVREGPGLKIIPAGRRIDYDPDDETPLLTAARLIQEDLLLIERGVDEWGLTAASVTFPSYWSLTQKFDRTMTEIHETVPGFSGQMAARVGRVFDNLKPDQPVWRLNWSVHDENSLFLPSRTRPSKFDQLHAGGLRADIFVRVERQTLRRLPHSGAILFTIKTYIDPLSAIAACGRPDLIHELSKAVSLLDDAQLSYKGLKDHRDALLSALRSMAVEPTNAT